MSALPSLRQLGYLVALADTLNFTRAAQRCFVTQSTLSGALQELERTLGGQLVERSRQQVRLTPAGERAVARARGLLAAARDLADEVGGLTRPMEGLARLGAIPTIAPFLLPALMGALRNAHPGLRLALREDTTASLLARLREGSVDFAIIALPWDTDGLRVETIAVEELWLVAPRGDPALSRASLRVDAIDAQRLLLLEEGHCLREHTLAGCGQRESANPGGIEATSLTTLIPMIEAGLGIALLPEMALKAGLLERTRLIARPLAAPAPRRTIALAARPTSARQAEFEAIAARARALASGRPLPGRRNVPRRATAQTPDAPDAPAGGGGAAQAPAPRPAQPPRSAS